MQFGQFIIDGILTDGRPEGSSAGSSARSRFVLLHFTYLGTDIGIGRRGGRSRILVLRPTLRSDRIVSVQIGPGCVPLRVLRHILSGVRRVVCLLLPLVRELALSGRNTLLGSLVYVGALGACLGPVAPVLRSLPRVGCVTLVEWLPGASRVVACVSRIV